MPEKKSERVNLLLTPTMKRECEKWAEEKDMNIQQFIRHCIAVCTTLYTKREEKK